MKFPASNRFDCILVGRNDFQSALVYASSHTELKARSKTRTRRLILRKSQHDTILGLHRFDTQFTSKPQVIII